LDTELAEVSAIFSVVVSASSTTEVGEKSTGFAQNKQRYI
jgi:hypothetical protein